MVRPMTASRSAIADVRLAVLREQGVHVPPSPCRVWMSRPESSLTSLGESAAKSGLKPLKSTVRSSAGWVRDSGIVEPSASGAGAPAPWDSAT